MRKIKLYIAASIDGYIAYTDGGLEWLSQYPITPEFNYGYDSFYKSVDSVILGGKSYRAILNMDFVYPYKDKKSYIISKNMKDSNNTDNIHFITDDVVNVVKKLKQEPGKDIWLVGGGEIIALLLDYDLVDEMTITYIPTMLGDGIPLFPKFSKESKWNLRNSQSYKNGVLSIEYQRVI